MSRVRLLLVAALVTTGLSAAPAAAAGSDPSCRVPLARDGVVALREGKPFDMWLDCTNGIDRPDLTIEVVGSPTHGEVVGEASWDPDLGYHTLRYDPSDGYLGPDQLTLRVTDADGTNDMTVGFTMSPNRPFTCSTVASIGHTGVDALRTVTGDCADLDTQDYTGLDFTVTDAPVHGEATASTERSITIDGQDWASTYTPGPGFVGSDQYTVTASDGEFTKELLIRVNVADGPWCSQWPETLSVRAGKTATFGTLCTQPSGSPGPLKVRVVDLPQQGTTAVHLDTGIKYTPDGTASGPDVFTYQAYSPAGESNVVSQSWDVTPDAAPVCEPATLTVPTDSPANVPLTCTDADDDAITLATARQPDHGTLSEIAEGQVTYTPDPGFVGTDRFSYTGSDYARTSAPAVVRITVDDGKAPVLDLYVSRGQSPRGVARNGLALYESADEQVTATTEVTVSRRTAKRLGLARGGSGPVRIAFDRSRFEWDVSVLALIHLTDRAATAIRPALSVPITVRFRGVDPLGNVTSVRVRTTLRR